MVAKAAAVRRPTLGHPHARLAEGDDLLGAEGGVDRGTLRDDDTLGAVHLEDDVFEARSRDVEGSGVTDSGELVVHVSVVPQVGVGCTRVVSFFTCSR